MLDGKADDHFIISIEVDPHEFNFSGGLTKAGLTHFWDEINKGMKRFDDDEITLKPRQKTMSNNLAKNKNASCQPHL